MLTGNNPRLTIADELQYPKATAHKHVWEIAEGLFDYSDEIGDFSGEFHKTVEAAKAALDAYCLWLTGQ